MITSSYEIAGGDFEHGGRASSSLKEQLKRIGADPGAVRRAMIAAYEAEMNVVIHAHKGVLEFVLDEKQLDVEVRDEGPGIPDIALAMTEGYSTAPEAARDLGFGAGMGLPNIKKSSDCFAIQSTVGVGTRVAFTVYLKPEKSAEEARSSVHVAQGHCRGCLRCVSACPTGALRVRGGVPVILEHLCLDCPVCIGACTGGALAMKAATRVPTASGGTVLVVSSCFFAQFGAGVSPQRVMGALGEAGFREVAVLEAWERALRGAVVEYARGEVKARPVISPACPVVVNLIEMRFPALIPHLAPFLSPVEAAREALAGRHVVLAAACPAMRTALVKGGASTDLETVLPASLRRRLLPAIHAGGKEAERVATGQSAPKEALLRVTGIGHVMRALEAVENGLASDVEAMEPWACEQGCFGSPLWSEDAFLALHRSRGVDRPDDPPARAIRRAKPFAARAGLRLDSDMAKAIAKLAEISALGKGLPGRDCGACGAPSCTAFAEDVVLGRADRGLCVHLAVGERALNARDSGDKEK